MAVRLMRRWAIARVGGTKGRTWAGIFIQSTCTDTDIKLGKLDGFRSNWIGRIDSDRYMDKW